MIENVSWIGLACERKTILDEIKDIAKGLIKDFQFEEGDSLNYNEVMQKLNKIFELSNEDNKW